MENKGISQYIKDRLNDITTGNALPMHVLVSDIIKQFPHIKDTTNASVRINSVLNQAKVREKFTRLKAEDKKVYIVLKEAVTGASASATSSTRTETVAELGELDEGQN